MESIETYLERKYREIRLIRDCLRSPRQVSRPRTVDEAIAAKFQLTAVLRAEHELQDWNATETAWSSTARPASGPFKFQYDYQRTVTCLMPGATETEFFRRADMTDTRVGTEKKDDSHMVAKAGFEAMMGGESDVVTGMKNKLQTTIANVTPNEVLAKQHRKMAEPGTAKS
jgi:hypothetical protein